MINWKVRAKNKLFWLALIPALLILAQTALAVFGVELYIEEVSNRLISLVNAVFSVLAVLGIVNDPTTVGISDSSLAMTYNSPKKDTEGK